METVIPHTHNGMDSPKIKLGDLLSVTDSIPTYSAKEGTVVLYTDGTDYRIYVMINKLWKYANLT